MDQSTQQEITRILGEGGLDDASRSESLVRILYPELRRMARRLMDGERPGQTLDPTALVHEAYLRLVDEPDRRWENRRHFVGAAAQAMRRILIDRARRMARERHGGERVRIDLDAALIPATESHARAMVALERSLARLGDIDPRRSEIVVLRYFGGLSVEETARHLELSERTVKREWRFTCAWLYGEMMDGEA